MMRTSKIIRKYCRHNTMGKILAFGLLMTLPMACKQNNDISKQEALDDLYDAGSNSLQQKINELNMQRPKTVDGITYERYTIEDKFMIFAQTMDSTKYERVNKAFQFYNIDDKDNYKKDLIKRLHENPDLIEIATLCKNEDVGISYKYVNKETGEAIRIDISPFDL